MSYDIRRSTLRTEKLDDENWDGYTIPKISENFFVDTSLADDTKFDKSKKFKKADDLLGRGRSDSGRSEPEYVGVSGYVAIGWKEEETMRKSDSPSTLCPIPIYEKKSSKYSEIGTVENNTEIGVISQNLTHSGWGSYEGYLLVQDKDGEQFYIDVNNFVTKPYYDY